MKYDKPNPYERNAMVFVDFCSVSVFDATECERLSQLVQKSDTLCISSGNDSVRFSFGVKDIWSDREDG